MGKHKKIDDYTLTAKNVHSVFPIALALLLPGLQVPNQPLGDATSIRPMRTLISSASLLANITVGPLGPWRSDIPWHALQDDPS